MPHVHNDAIHGRQVTLRDSATDDLQTVNSGNESFTILNIEQRKATSSDMVTYMFRRIEIDGILWNAFYWLSGSAEIALAATFISYVNEEM